MTSSFSSFLKKGIFLIISLVFIGFLSPHAFAADDSISILQANVLTTNDADGNGFANIGDQLTIGVVINNTDGGCVAQNTQVTADLRAYGGSATQALNCFNDTGGANDQFNVQITIQDGGANAIDVGGNNLTSRILVTVSDSDEDNGAGSANPTQLTNCVGDGFIDTVATNGVDTDGPVVTDAGISASISTDNGQAGVAGVGDVILITYTPSTDSINDPNPNQILANLSTIGGSANQQLFDDATNGDVTNADGTYSFALTITEGAGGGIDAAGLTVGVTVEDDAGNSSGAAVNDGNTFSVDNVSPTVSDPSISASIQVDNNTDGTANTNDVIRVTWDNSAGGDNNSDTLTSITVNLSAFGGGANQQLFDDGTNGDVTNADGIYTFDFTVGTGAINTSNLNASVSTTDNGGNTTQGTDSSNLSVNNTTTGTSTGGRRRISTIEESDKTDTQESSTTTEDEEVNIFGQRFESEGPQEAEELRVNSYATDCGCDEEFNDFLAGGDTSPFLTEEEEQEVADNLKEAQDKLTDANKKYNKALEEQLRQEELFNQALKEAGQASGEMINSANSTDPNNADEVAAHEQKVLAAQEARDHADQVYEDYKSAVRAKHEAEEAVRNAQRELDEAKKEARESLGNERTAEILRDLLEPTEKLEECLRMCPIELPQSFSETPREFPNTLFTSPKDIFSNSAEPFILQLHRKGIVSGINNSHQFGPDQLLDRAAMLKIVLKSFGHQVPDQSRRNPFPDVDQKEWYAPYFEEGKNEGIIQGFPDGLAKPAENVSRVQALVMLTRAAKVDLSLADNHEPAFKDFNPNEWWSSAVRWADMYGIIDGNQEYLHGGEEITRGEMSEMTSLTTNVINNDPCDCDDEKKAWEEAQKNADQAQREADQAQTAADQAAADLANAEKEVSDAKKKVADLQKFFNTSSFVESDGEKVTAGDLELLSEANAGVFAAWKAGSITAEEASEEWSKIDKEKLEELREQKRQELEAAQKEVQAAEQKVDDAKQAVEIAQFKAEQAQRRANEAQKRADAARFIYEECRKKCEQIEKEMADFLRKQAEERREWEEEVRNQREQAQREAEASSEAEGEHIDTENGDSSQPVGAKDPCEEKFAQALQARAKQILESRGEAPEPSSSTGETALDLATNVGDAVAGIAQTLATGGTNAAAALAATSSAINNAYGLWVNYVGSAIKDAGQRIIANRRICQYIKFSTDDICGYVVLNGQTVFYERKGGQIHVLVMGPGDETVAGSCEG